MPAREAASHQPTRSTTPTAPTPVTGELVDDWSRFEDGWVEA
jgi:hypothetical protein